MTTQRGRTEAYSTGNKTYGMGRSNPTSGTVDPAGYVQRAMNKKSDRRSGLAAAALRRLQGNSPQAVQPQAPTRPLPFQAIQLPNGQRIVPNATGQYQLDEGQM